MAEPLTVPERSIIVSLFGQFMKQAIEKALLLTVHNTASAVVSPEATIFGIQYEMVYGCGREIEQILEEFTETGEIEYKDGQPSTRNTILQLSGEMANDLVESLPTTTTNASLVNSLVDSLVDTDDTDADHAHAHAPPFVIVCTCEFCQQNEVLNRTTLIPETKFQKLVISALDKIKKDM